MPGTVINFEERRREAQIKKGQNVFDLRTKFHNRSVRDDIPKVDTESVAFSRTEFRAVLHEINTALGDGLIKDYAAPMSTSARPIFSFKSRTQDPDLFSLEKARTEDDTIYIVRMHGKTPDIETSFQDAMTIIRDELDHLRNKKQIRAVPDLNEPDTP